MAYEIAKQGVKQLHTDAQQYIENLSARSSQRAQPRHGSSRSRLLPLQSARMLRLANCRLPRYFRPCSTGLSAPRARVGDFLVRGRVASKTRREVRCRELDFPGRGTVQNETARRPHPLEITGLTLYLVNGVRLAAETGKRTAQLRPGSPQHRSPFVPGWIRFINCIATRFVDLALRIAQRRRELLGVLRRGLGRLNCVQLRLNCKSIFLTYSSNYRSSLLFLSYFPSCGVRQFPADFSRRIFVFDKFARRISRTVHTRVINEPCNVNFS